MVQLSTTTAAYYQAIFCLAYSISTFQDRLDSTDAANVITTNVHEKICC